MSSSSPEKKYFDISKPGKTPPNTTSRSIIVTNRSMVKDPTLRQEEISSDEDKKKDDEEFKMAKSEAKPLDPTSEGIKLEKPEVKETEVPQDSSNAEDQNDQISPERIDQKKIQEQSLADKARQKEIDKLVSSEKYALPIGHIKRNRRLLRGFFMIVLVLLVLFVCADLIVDAGIIKTDIKPLVDIIKNK